MSKLSQFFRDISAKEKWKPIKDYEGLYEISNRGRIKSLAKTWISGNGSIREKRETILKANQDGNGYLFINLCKNKKRTIYKTAHLVWDHFGNKSRNGRILQVDHIDNNKQNDRIDNLQLLSQRENLLKGFIQNGKKTSRFTGVYYYRITKKWIAHIRINGKQKHLGYFIDEYQANLAYQKALKNINKEN